MTRTVVNKFNRGELDPLALARDDVKKVNNSAETMENFFPMRLGPMIYRPGMEYISTLSGAIYQVPFVASTTDNAMLRLTTTDMSVVVDDAVISRTTSTMTLVNQSFTSDLAGWTPDDTGGSSSTWKTGGYASLLGDGDSSAKIYQTFKGSASDTGIRFTISKSPCDVKIGTTGKDSVDIFEGTLGIGVHSFLIPSPSALPTITLSNFKKYETLVDSVAIESAGEISIPLPNTITNLSSIRTKQSADVVYVTTDSEQQFKIVRYGVRSWTVEEYNADDGPFGIINITDISLTPTSLSGDTTLTASGPLFTATSVGQLYKISSAGQSVTASVTVEDTGTASVRVIGSTDSVRAFTLSRSGTWSGTVTLQRSTDDSSWQDVESYTTNGSKTYTDSLKPSVIYYRLWVKTGNYTSGTVLLDITYTSGSIDGVCRITGFTSSTSVSVQVINDFGSLTASKNWYAGEWSDALGYPTATDLYEGRLWFGGKKKIWGSVSDAYESFDDSTEGASAPISKTIGVGPVDVVGWLAGISRLLVGVASDVISVRSNSLGEPLTSTNTNLKSGNTQGADAIEPERLDNAILYVHRTGNKLMLAEYDFSGDNSNSSDLMVLNPSIASAGIKRIAISRQPETRIYVVLDDGEMRVYLYDNAEDVAAWSKVTTDGTIEDVAVKPGTTEDEVYIVVNRDGGRYHEKFSLLANVVSEHFDSFVSYTSPSGVLTGLDHLEGKTVGVWADSQDRGTFIVSGGSITTGNATWTNVVAGLKYNADYKTGRIGGYIPESVQGTLKKIIDVHLSMIDYWPAGIQLGPTFSDLEIMPLNEYGTTLDTTTLISKYDELPVEFNGDDEVDPRICIRATAPCTILSLTYGVYDENTSNKEE